MITKGYKLTNNRIRDLRDRVISQYLIRCEMWRDSQNTGNHSKLDQQYAESILRDVIDNLNGLYWSKYKWLRKGLTLSDQRFIANEACKLHKEKMETYPWYREGNAL